MISLRDLPGFGLPPHARLQDWFCGQENYPEPIRSAPEELCWHYEIWDRDASVPASILLEKFKEIESSAHRSAFWSRPVVRLTTIVVGFALGVLGVAVVSLDIPRHVAMVVTLAGAILLARSIIELASLIENVVRKDSVLGERTPYLALPSHSAAYEWQAQSARDCIDWVEARWTPAWTSSSSCFDTFFRMLYCF